ncbi:secreted RxLR effector protein 161-like [Cryptomeria japonica]|uniref:secreted RxLR effector protein 161-like n=1 Tax=Cryptomeria japonica TaxID=3369 RepID=UPI0027DA80AE|nr:secreted RxLR effector protein 161-like [Cryptomeria japonica]
MSSPMEKNLHKLKEAAIDSQLADPTLYRQMIGSLMYLVNTRLNICYAMNAFSQFMCEPKEIHLVAMKHIMRYLQGTLNYGLKYGKVDLDLHGFIDSDWVGSMTDQKSTSGCCFSLGLAMISWISRKQSSVAQSSTKAKYIVASMAVREAIWLRKLLVGLFGEPLKPTVIHCYNQSCIKLSVNLVFHDRSKHIVIPYHYVRDMVERNVIQLEYISTGDQTTDILTKPLSRVKVEHFRKSLGMIEM